MKRLSTNFYAYFYSILKEAYHIFFRKIEYDLDYKYHIASFLSGLFSENRFALMTHVQSEKSDHTMIKLHNAAL